MRISAINHSYVNFGKGTQRPQQPDKDPQKYSADNYEDAFKPIDGNLHFSFRSIPDGLSSLKPIGPANPDDANAIEDNE